MIGLQMFGHMVYLLARGDPGEVWYQSHKPPHAAHAENHNIEIHKLQICKFVLK